MVHWRIEREDGYYVSAVHNTEGDRTNLGALLRELEEERDHLERAIAALRPLAAANTSRVATVLKSPHKSLSKEARSRIAAEQRARWARVKSGKTKPSSKRTRTRIVSAAARRKMAAAQRARWARVRAQKSKKSA